MHALVPAVNFGLRSAWCLLCAQRRPTWTTACSLHGGQAVEYPALQAHKVDLCARAQGRLLDRVGGFLGNLLPSGCLGAFAAR
jgi:hypothetical protein